MVLDVRVDLADAQIFLLWAVKVLVGGLPGGKKGKIPSLGSNFIIDNDINQNVKVINLK